MMQANRGAIWQECKLKIDPRILIPGFAGELAPDEMADLRNHLAKDPEVRYGWGFRRGRKTFPEALLRRIAMEGDPDTRAGNVAIVAAWRQASLKSQASKARGFLPRVSIVVSPGAALPLAS